MRFKIDVYKQSDYPEVIKLMQQEKDFNLPCREYLRCLGLICIDTKINKIVGFLTTISGLSNTAYIDYLIIDKDYRNKGLSGNRILALLFEKLEIALRMMNIKAYLGHVSIDNKGLKHLYIRKQAQNLGDYTLFRREIPNEKAKTTHRHPNQAVFE